MSNTDPVRAVLDHLGESVKPAGNGKWSAKCPVHDDRTASLSITTGNDGRVLLHCHAGCSNEDVCAALGIKLADLFPQNGNGNGAKPSPTIVATYDYLNAENELIYQVVRYSPKDFRQRRPDGNGGYLWNMNGVRRVLYRLPDLLNAFEDRPDDWIMIAEGEKDVDSLRAAGLIATCNVGGAGKWTDEYSETLRGRCCCIVADKDGPGRKHAQQVAASLHVKAADVRIVECPGDGVKDASDFITAGGTADQLLALVEAAPKWEQTAPEPDDSFAPVPLGAIWQSDPELRKPIIDGLLRRGEVGNLISTSKQYKTYLVLGLAISMVGGKQWLDRFPCCAGRVLIIDMELQKPSITKRTLDIAAAMHVAPEDIADKIEIIALRGRAATIDEIERIILGVQPRTYSAIIIDPLYKTYPAGFDENSNSQMTALYRRWERMAEHLDGALLIVHHGTKGSQADKRVVDVGAGASAQSRSADCHIALREHEQPDAVVLECRVRSFPPVEPMVLRWSYPLWKRDLSLSPDDLKTNRRSRGAEKEPEAVGPKAEPWTVERFVATFITGEPQQRNLIEARARQAKIKDRETKDFITLAIADKRVFEWSFSTSNAVFLASREQTVAESEESPSKTERKATKRGAK